MTDTLLEKEFQEKIFNSSDIQKGILSLYDFPNDSTFEREIEFINGITSDFIIYDSNKEMKAILECKRADIGVTEYVRGVGQLFQYEYFQDEHISPRKYADITYTADCNNNFLVIPSSFIKNTKLNIGKFRYPNHSGIIEIHEKNNHVRLISEEEFVKLSKAVDNDLITISQYYVKDNRLFEHYILYKFLKLLNEIANREYSRPQIEDIYLRNISVINNNNWRNAFISLSSYGLIARKSKLTNVANKMIDKDVHSFIEMIYSDYIFPFVDEIMSVLVKFADNSGKVKLKNLEIAQHIRRKYNGKDVLFLTDSNSRYISSWLNIMRDDIGCLSFETRSKERQINFIPKELTSEKRLELIKQHSIAQSYVDNFESVKQDLVRKILENDS